MTNQFAMNGKMYVVHESGHTDVYTREHYETLLQYLNTRIAQRKKDVTDVNRCITEIDASVQSGFAKVATKTKLVAKNITNKLLFRRA